MHTNANPASHRPPPWSTGLARFISTLLAEAERQGESRESLLAATGISDARLRDPDARIPASWAHAVWKELTTRFPDPDLGVRFGSVRKVRELGLVGYTMLHSRTLFEALERLARYGAILVDHAVLPLARLPEGGVRMEFGNAPAPGGLRQPVDYRLTWLVVAARELTGVPIVPTEVRIPFPRTVVTRERTSVLGTNLQFDAPAASLVFSAADLALPIASAEEDLGDYLEQLAAQTLAGLGLDPDSLSDRVRREIWSQLRGRKATLEAVSHALGVGVRSLQRRLNEEHTSFAALLDEVLHSVAVRLLLEQDLSVQEIGFFLGYSDASAFHRAFCRWEGIAPKRFRQRVKRPA